MKPTDRPSPTMLAHRLRAWLDGGSEDAGERRARMLMAWLLWKALSCRHFGFFLWVLNAVDGKIRLTAEEEMTFESYSGPQKVDHSGHLHLLRLFPLQPSV